MTDIDRLLDIMRRLRDPREGCPWDRAQSFASIAPFTIEEAYEAADAIARGDLDDLKGELGDLLFQIVFHAQLAAEAGRFDFAAVVNGIVDKLVRRHPHVFGDTRIDDAAAQSQAWEAHKARERAAAAASKGRAAGLLDDVPLALPALSRAAKLQRRAARVGFDWERVGDIFAKIEEETGELREAVEQGGDPRHITEELGDLLFAVVNVARFLEHDPEEALRAANRKFERRFRYIEQRLAAQGRRCEEVTLQDMELLWEEAKRGERG